MRVGFVGLGNMGLGMAQNLVKAGHATTVYDLRPEAVDVALAAGAVAAPSYAELARASDLVCVAVFDESQVRAVVQGAPDQPGVLAAATPGTIIAVHSTVSPGLVQELGARAAEVGVSVIDVAMTGGGDVAAAEGALTFMVGGSSEAVERARPAFSAMARTIFHVGALGSGVSAKIISNFLGSSNVALTREALRIAAGAGLGERQILGIIEQGGVGSSWVSNNWERIRTQEANYTTGTDGMVAMWSKDLKLALDLAEANAVPAPIAEFIVADVVPEVRANGFTN